MIEEMNPAMTTNPMTIDTMTTRLASLMRELPRTCAEHPPATSPKPTAAIDAGTRIFDGFNRRFEERMLERLTAWNWSAGLGQTSVGGAAPNALS